MKMLAIAALCLSFSGLPAPVASAQVSVGVKGGLVFPIYSAHDKEFPDSDRGDYFEARGSWQVGVFIRGNQQGAFSLQAEASYLHKEGDVQACSGLYTSLNYLQVPVLLRLQTQRRPRVYAIMGPSLDVKLREATEGNKLGGVHNDFFERVDCAAVLGGGVEGNRALLEVRYSRGLRKVFDALSARLKSHSFAVLVGIRIK